ncbi:hypothetical protein TNCT6_35600 [Streptomyces sp. 6-11-2]|nr:hypothetical protein TNCT6_35600 [Streptomyces sp. 6-11-2]
MGANTACRVGRLAGGGLTTGDGTGCHACSLAMVGQRAVLQMLGTCFGTLLGCPASDGNNDWNPDRIPNPPTNFLIMQYPVSPQPPNVAADGYGTAGQSGTEGLPGPSRTPPVTPRVRLRSHQWRHLGKSVPFDPFDRLPP